MVCALTWFRAPNLSSVMTMLFTIAPAPRQTWPVDPGIRLGQRLQEAQTSRAESHPKVASCGTPTRGLYPRNTAPGWVCDLTSNRSQSPETVSYSLNVVRTARIKHPRTIRNLEQKEERNAEFQLAPKLDREGVQDAATTSSVIPCNSRQTRKTRRDWHSS